MFFIDVFPKYIFAHYRVRVRDPNGAYENREWYRIEDRDEEEQRLSRAVAR